MLAIDNYRFSLNISWQNYDQEDLLFIFSHKKQQNYNLEGSAREMVKLWIQNPGITHADLLNHLSKTYQAPLQTLSDAIDEVFEILKQEEIICEK